MPSPEASDPIAWYLANRPVLFGFLRVIVPHDVAEDAMQETFLELQRSGGRFTAGADPGAWVRGVARNVARQALARRRRLLPMAPDALIDRFDQAAAELAAEEASTTDLVGHLRGCVGRLSEPQRRLLHQRYADGRSLAELAASTGRSSGAVQVALSRLRASLLGCIERSRKASP